MLEGVLPEGTKQEGRQIYISKLLARLVKMKIFVTMWVTLPLSISRCCHTQNDSMSWTLWLNVDVGCESFINYAIIHYGVTQCKGVLCPNLNIMWPMTRSQSHHMSCVIPPAVSAVIKMNSVHIHYQFTFGGITNSAGFK